MTTSFDEARRFLSLAADDLAALPHIRPAIAFFHAQQAIEKNLKAVLFARGEEFRKTHDLYELADRLAKTGFTLPYGADELAQINPYAVEFRYGDETIQIIIDTITRKMVSWAEASVGGMQT